MIRLITFLLLLSSVSSFTTPSWGKARLQKVRPAFMAASNDEDKTSPLVPEEVAFKQEAATPKNVVREMNTGERKSLCLFLFGS